MNIPSPLACKAAAIAAIAFFLADPATAADAGLRWHPLLNGRDLSGWAPPENAGVWRVTDGVLHGENNEKLTGSMLWTEKSYGDVMIEAEVRWDATMDSGIFVRKPALQMQIGTSVSLKRDMTGSFYLSKGGYIDAGQAKEAAKYLKMGDWNTIRLEARGSVYTVWINGRQVAQYTDAAHPEPGPIGVQVHQKVKGNVEFRALRVAELH